jgi:N utilization substance protein A
VPEIADGIVEIKACAREPGARTKIAVYSHDSNVDPVGACVGARGARVRMVVNELRGEKIDIVPFSEIHEDFVAKALSPAKVREVRIDDTTGTATVIVPDFQLSLAIGKEGQNARLSARLTGWRVDIKSETQLAEEEAYAGQDWAEGEWVVDPESGEQVWQPAEGGEAMSAEQWSQATAGGDEGDATDITDTTEGVDATPEADAATETAPAATPAPEAPEASAEEDAPVADAAEEAKEPDAADGGEDGGSGEGGADEAAEVEEAPAGDGPAEEA